MPVTDRPTDTAPETAATRNPYMDMGSAKYAAKYRAKYGREPTDEELAAYTKKCKDKKEARKVEKAAAEVAVAAPPPPPPPPPPPAAEGGSSKKDGKRKAASSAPVVPTASAAASGSRDSAVAGGAASSSSSAASRSSKASGKRKRSEAAASEMQRAKVVGKVAGLGIEVSQNGVRAAAAAQSRAGHLSNDAFKAVWTEHVAGAEALLATFEEGVAHLAEQQREALIAPYRERLALSLTPADDVIERCRSKQAAKDAARRAKAARRTPRTPKEHAVEPAIRDAGLAVLREHRCVVLRLF